MMHQLRFALRVFLKDRFFSLLNILGLALGISVSIILLLILQNDLTYDQHHVMHERIYRLGAHEKGTGVDFRVARAARELANILRDEIPEVEDVVRANSWGRTLVKYKPVNGDEQSWYEENIVRTDSNYFKLFTHSFIAGNPSTCLVNPVTVVLTESTAKKYFGDEPALDQQILIRDELHTVTAVIEDVPENTHLKFDLLISQLTDRQWAIQNGAVVSEAFWNPDVYTYILFPENYDTQQFYGKFPAIYDRYFKSFGDGVGGSYEPILEPLARVHFYSDLGSDEPQGNIAYLYAFTAIGFFIILLACINYMNLSTAKSVNRAGEIAMKKTLGSGKTRLVVSFLSESLLLSIFAMLLACVLVYVTLNFTSFNSLVSKNLSADFLGNKVLLLGSISVTLCIGLISGLYPAFYLPSIPTLKALKGAYKNQKSSLILRKGLTTFQFAISIFVVVCTFFMQDQIRFVRSKELGFDKENVVVLNIQDTIVERQVEAIKNEFLSNPKIIAAATSYSVPGFNAGGQTVMFAESESGMKQQAFNVLAVGDNYLKTMGIELLSGRDFKPGKDESDRAFIANEAAVKLMGWGDAAVGKKIHWFHADDKTTQIIGTVKDFNFSSLHNAIEPAILVRAGGDGGFLHLRIAAGNIPETLEFVRKTWTKYDVTHPFEYFFLDEKFNEQYKADEVQFKLVSGLSYVCIFVSLLGLLGLSGFTTSQRTKEIGIRKVHGASIPHIIYLLYKDVMLLVIIAAVLIVPVSWYVMNEWLGNFAYRTPMNYLLFGLVAILALATSFMTVAFHSLKAARTNPVQSLKYE